MPDVPTLIEAGYANFDVDLWLGLFAPINTPTPLLRRLNSEIDAALGDAAVMAAFAKVGVEPRINSAEEGARFVRAEYYKWAHVVRSANLKAK